jgi:hypothetical protein
VVAPFSGGNLYGSVHRFGPEAATGYFYSDNMKIIRLCVRRDPVSFLGNNTMVIKMRFQIQLNGNAPEI